MLVSFEIDFEEVICGFHWNFIHLTYESSMYDVYMHGFIDKNKVHFEVPLQAPPLYFVVFVDYYGWFYHVK